MKKKILISVYDMEIGGIERSLINMLDNFDYDSYDVDLLIFNHTGEFIKFIPKQVNVLPQINDYAIFRKPITTCIKEGFYKTSIIRVICKLVANIKYKLFKYEECSGYYQIQLALKHNMRYITQIETKYDIAISYAWPHEILLNKVNANKKIAWIHTDYSSLDIDNKMDLKTWEKFDFIVSVSEECKNSFTKVYPNLIDKVIVVENITSPNLIKILSKETIDDFEHATNIFNIVSVGRYSEAKGFDNAIKALRLLNDRGFKNIKWSIIGYGSDEDLLKSLIKENSLEDSFILLGKKINPYPYMKNCDLYVQPSRYEGKAVTVTEAQILNKPVLITNYPTANSQINDGEDGVICELSIEGIADGIEKLLLNKNLLYTLEQNLLKKDFNNKKELIKLYEVIKR